MANQTKSFSNEFINSYIEGIIQTYIYNNSGLDNDYWNYLDNVMEIEGLIISTPIKKIDGVECEVCIIVSRECDIQIKVIGNYNGIHRAVWSKFVYRNYSEERREWEENNDSEFCLEEPDYYAAIIRDNVSWQEDFKHILNLKYNPIIAEFVDYVATKDDLELMGYNIGECSVCYEDTIFTCKNNHHTCMDCQIKIKRNNAANRKCPICRGNW